MKTVLLASAAALAFAFSDAALAQTTEPAPAQTEAQAETPVANEVEAQPSPPDAAPAAAADGEADAAASAEAEAAVPPSDAADNAAALAASPASPATDANRNAASANAADVCEPRVTSVQFTARGSALSRENRNTIEHAVDAASVCNLQSVVIASGDHGSLGSRRAEAVRATLIRQGVPRGTIAIEAGADADSATAGQLAVRMTFAGVATAGAPAAAEQTTAEDKDEAEPTTPAS